MHLALSPGAAINDSVGVGVYALALHEVGSPAALIHIPIRVTELATLTGLVTIPVAFVHRAIGPLHGTRTMTHPAQPSPTVNCTGSCIGVRALLKLGRVAKVTHRDFICFDDCFFRFIFGEVFQRL